VNRYVFILSPYCSRLHSQPILLPLGSKNRHHMKKVIKFQPFCLPWYELTLECGHVVYRTDKDHNKVNPR
jgi:hypothetical protein